MEKQLLKVTEAAEILSLSRSRVYELTKEGDDPLPVIHIGSSVRVPVVALRAWVERQMVGQGVGAGPDKGER